MKKVLNAPKYKIGDAVSYCYNNCENNYRISRIAGIVNYDDEYKYLLDEDIHPNIEFDVRLLLSEDSIIEKIELN